MRAALAARFYSGYQIGADMILRAALVLGSLVLAACAPQVPDSGVGFNSAGNNYPYTDSYGASSNNVAQAPAGFSPSSALAAIDRAEGITSAPAYDPYAAPAAPMAQPNAVQPIAAQPVAAGGVLTATRVSDENDFNAVAARETIESDAQRIAQNRAQYVVVQPKDLPQRPGDTGPNIVEYALRTTNAPGQTMFSRSRLFAKDPLAACAQFGSPDQAQRAFLENGGPDRDKLGVDPDGDGFACAWDPRPFRAALQ